MRTDVKISGCFVSLIFSFIDGGSYLIILKIGKLSIFYVPDLLILLGGGSGSHISMEILLCLFSAFAVSVFGYILLGLSENSELKTCLLSSVL